DFKNPRRIPSLMTGASHEAYNISIPGSPSNYLKIAHNDIKYLEDRHYCLGRVFQYDPFLQDLISTDTPTPLSRLNQEMSEARELCKDLSWAVFRTSPSLQDGNQRHWEARCTNYFSLVDYHSNI